MRGHNETKITARNDLQHKSLVVGPDESLDDLGFLSFFLSFSVF